MNVRDKFDCLSLAGLSGLVYCFWVRPGAYPRVEHLRRAAPRPYWQTFDRAGMPCRGKHSSLLWTFIDYRRKKFLKIEPWA